MSTALLPAAVFLSAAACLAVELAIVRLAAPHLGQSLLPWTAAIATVLLGLTLGHVLGGRAGGAARRPGIPGQGEAQSTAEQLPGQGPPGHDRTRAR